MYYINNFKYFSEQCGAEVISTVDAIFSRNAELLEVIFITAPCMCGKSTFIKTDLCEYARKTGRKILMLVPRTPIKQQFEIETANSEYQDVIDIETFQKFEKRTTKAIDAISGVYDIVVLDESHHATSDSQFDLHTDRSLERMLTYQAVKIFMSATPEPAYTAIQDVFTELEPDAKWHTFEGEGVSLLKDVKFFGDGSRLTDEQCLDCINGILDEIDKTDEKAIIFCHNLEMAKNLYIQREMQSLFVCAESNRKYNAYMDRFARDYMLQNERFECKYLICTSTMEMGVTLKDPKLKHIICTIPDYNSIIQAIGRKRPFNGDLSDTFMLYLKDRNGYTIQGAVETNKQAFEHYNYLKQHGEAEYLAEYFKEKDPSHIVHCDTFEDGATDAHPQIDKMILAKYQHERAILKEIQKLPYGNANYKAWIYTKFGLTPYPKRKAYAIFKHLEELIGQTFSKKEFHVIVDIINYRRTRTNTEKGANNTLIRDMDVLNEYLTKIGVDIIIKKGQDPKTRRMVYWVERKTQAIQGKSNTEKTAKGA